MVASAQEEFKARIQSWLVAMNDMKIDVSVANAQVDRLRKWVATLDERGIARDVLLPLLSDEMPVTRYGAAAYLLRRGEADRALPLLQAMADDPKNGSLASAADTTLLGWRKEQRAAGQ
jgi:predicted Zn-dependent protease